MALDPQLDDAIARSFLAGVAPALVETLLGQARVREIPAGRVFITPDDQFRCGILVDGLARAYVVRNDGSETTVRRVGPGAAVGIKAVIGQRNDVSVAALADCAFLPLDSARLVELGHQHPDLGWAIAEEQGRHLSDTQRVLQWLWGTVAQRAAGLLLDLIVDDEAGVTISVEALADRIGASREATGRALHQLADAGLIRRLRARIVVNDVPGLERAARGGDDDDAPLRADFTAKRGSRPR